MMGDRLRRSPAVGRSNLQLAADYQRFNSLVLVLEREFFIALHITLRVKRAPDVSGGETKMQRHGFGWLYDWFASFQRTASKGKSAQGKSAQGRMAERSASPILVFVVNALLLILAILLIDLHRDELRAFGFIFDGEGSVPFFAGP